MNRYVLAGLTVALSVACSGPDVRSRSPLTDDEVGHFDPRLPGIWQVLAEGRSKGKTDEPAGLVQIQPARGAQVSATWLPSAPSRGMAWTGAVSGQVGGRWYLSVQGREAGTEDKGIDDFYVLRCDFEGDDTFHLWQLSRAPVQAAIDRGELRGRKGKSTEIRITSPTEDLAAWIVRQDPAEIFEPFIMLRRVTLPVPVAEPP